MAAEDKEYSALAVVIQELGRYYNVRSKSDFINKLIDLNTNQPAEGPPQTIAAQVKALQESPPEHALGQLFLDVTEGSAPIKQLLKKMEDVVKGADAATKAKLSGLFQIVYEPTALSSNELKAFAKPLVKRSGEAGDQSYTGAYAFVQTEATDHFGPGNPDPPPYEGEYADIWEPAKQGSLKNMMYTLTVDEALADRQSRARALGRPANEETPQPAENYLGVNENATAVGTKTKPNIMTVCINDPQLSPATKDSSAVSLWLSYIPTLEMSRCQVFLDVQIITNRPPVEDIGGEQKISTLSLLQFLEGNRTAVADEITTHAVNASLLSSPQYEDPPGNEPPQFASAGMELFTAPQTLVNANDFSGTPDAGIITGDESAQAQQASKGPNIAPRAATVLDRFRPLATMTGFSLDVQPAGGMMSMKTATLQITLHDRSRLAEMSQLIKPDIYGDTELMITYGWSHPDGKNFAGETYLNPFAALSNVMRVTEKFKVRNSSFSFDESGQVEISLDLYTVSEVALDVNDISKGPGVADASRQVNELIRTIRQIRRRLNPPGQQGSDDVVGETWINDVTSVNSIANMDDETKTAMRNWRANVRTSGASADTTELVAAYDGLFGTNGQGGAMSTLKRTIRQALNRKQEIILSPDSGDPYWMPILHDRYIDRRGRRTATKTFTPVKNHIADPRTSRAAGRLKTQREAIVGESDPKKARQAMINAPNKYVSLGKLVATYVLGPLASAEMFDEIHVFYYTFNQHASYVANRNIASFPINYIEFSAELEKLTRETAYVPLKRFLGMVNSKFIAKTYSDAYGMSDMYTPNDDGAMQLADTYKDSPTAFNDEKQIRLGRAYGHTDSASAPATRQKFKKPRLAMTTQVVTSNNPDADQKRPAKDITILKIHIYDKSCTPFNTMQDLLKASQNESMGTLNTTAREVLQTPAAQRTAEQRAQLTTVMESTGLVQAANANVSPVQYQVKGGLNAIKNFVRGAMPSVIYGSQHSGIIDASVSSMNDPQMASIHMLRSGTSSSRTPGQTRAAGLPLRVSPVEVSLKIYGCPVVNFGQQFFIDFGTGTTVDNVYAVTGVKHNLAPGEFTTDLTLIALDAYGAYESALSTVAQAMQTTSET